MKAGEHYNWKNQPERLVYIGRSPERGQGRWHQFEKVDEPGIVWCEVLDSDLHMLEPTQNPDEAPRSIPRDTHDQGTGGAGSQNAERVQETSNQGSVHKL